MWLSLLFANTVTALKSCFVVNFRNDVKHSLDRQGNPSWEKTKDEIYKKIVGSTVLTRYNNKTYRIDDIEWDSTPKDTFQKGREEVSYLSYYQ